MSENSSSNRPPRPSRPTQDQQTDLGGILGGSSETAHDGFMGIEVEQDEVTSEERKRVKRRSRNAFISAVLVFAVALVMVVAIISPRLGWFERKDYSGEGNGTTVTFTIAEGSSNIGIANSLEEQGIIADAGRFLEVYSETTSDQFFQPGEYELQKEMSSSAALNELLNLDEANTNYVAVSRTWRMDETFDALAKGTGISAGEFESLGNSPNAFGIPSNFPTIEGFLYPGEYRFPKDATAEEILQTMVDKTKEQLEADGVTGDDRIFHVLTVASILEFEGIEKDYAPIAGAIENRMNNPDGETSGYLQSDATVAYGLGIKSYHISNEQKADSSNKYNTFYYKGLPEGPIGSPGEAAIKAAANPEKNDYYFWVTVDLFTGETLFAETYEEHLDNVEIYDEFCANNKNACQ